MDPPLIGRSSRTQMLPALFPGIFFPTLMALITMEIEKQLLSDVWDMKDGPGDGGAWGGCRQRLDRKDHPGRSACCSCDRRTESL